MIWAELEDANGYRKARPAVVVLPTADIDTGGPVRVVAITTRLLDPLPEDHIWLPWDRQGKARSGLRRRCAAVASWQAEIAVGGIQEVVGILPPSVISELLGKVSTALSPPSQDWSAESDDPAVGLRSDLPIAPPPAHSDGQGDDNGAMI